jgi:MFS family permease
MKDDRPGLRRAVVALEHRDYRLFYFALVVAGVGAQVQATANLWQVYELTGSALQLGLIGLARGVPVVALSLMGGIVADRVDRRTFIVVTQVITGTLSLTLAVLTATHLIAVWQIYLVTFVGAVFTATNAPARSAMIPSLVPRHHLLNAIALSSTVWQTASIVGPALAGAAIAVIGLPATYLIDGAALVFSIASLTRLHLPAVPARPHQSALQSLLEGLAFVRQRSVILALLGMDVAASFFGSYRGLLPILVDNLGVGAEGLGLLISAPALGGLLGATIMMSLGDIRYKGLVVAGGILAYCGALVALALSPWFLVSLAVTLLLGVFDSVQMTPRSTIIQAITSDGLRGRVSSFQSMLTNGVPALGQTQNGIMASLLGAPVALAAGATACAAYVLGTVVLRRDLRDPDLGELSEAPRASG